MGQDKAQLPVWLPALRTVKMLNFNWPIKRGGFLNGDPETIRNSALSSTPRWFIAVQTGQSHITGPGHYQSEWRSARCTNCARPVNKKIRITAGGGGGSPAAATHGDKHCRGLEADPPARLHPGKYDGSRRPAAAIRQPLLKLDGPPPCCSIFSVIPPRLPCAMCRCDEKFYPAETYTRDFSYLYLGASLSPGSWELLHPTHDLLLFFSRLHAFTHLRSIVFCLPFFFVWSTQKFHWCVLNTTVH